MWSDVEKGKLRESYHSIALFDNWRLERVKDSVARTLHTAQYWLPANEAYYCRSRHDVDMIDLGVLGASGLGNYVGSFHGREQLGNESVLKLIVKPNIEEGSHVEYYVTESQEARNGTVMQVLPREFILHIDNNTENVPGTSGAAKHRKRRVAFVFERFEVVDSVPDAAFAWGEANYDPRTDNMFNETACASTMPYTSDESSIPRTSLIEGTSPFVPV